MKTLETLPLLFLVVYFILSQCQYVDIIFFYLGIRARFTVSWPPLWSALVSA